VLVPGVAWVGALAIGWEHSSSLLWMALLAVIVSQVAEHLQTRLELRAMVTSRTVPDDEVSAGG
jgi:hypothetical protein